MAISVFDLLEIGIGPPGSRTVGPVHAAALFTATLRRRQALPVVRRPKVRLYGSLFAVGTDHDTDRAVIMGPMDEWPDRISLTQIAPRMAALFDNSLLQLDGRVAIPFDWVCDMYLPDENLPYHPNAMTLVAYGEQGELHQETYYSMDRGFMVDTAQAASKQLDQGRTVLPYDFSSVEGLLLLCECRDLRVSRLMLINEHIWRNETDIREGLRCIWQAMHDYVNNGLCNKGILPSGLSVQCRAVHLYRNLQEIDKPNVIGSTLSAMEQVNLFVLAVNGENVAGGRMAIAPTSGAAGIVPAVLHYYMKFNPSAQDRDIADYLLATAVVGILCKKNASISGAEVSCQGGVGSACAMVTADLAEVLGATPTQVENVAEIGLEHNLRLTYDPVGGLVQMPCIERNAIAMVKAINTVQVALRGDDQYFISLDRVIRTMRDTGVDMHDKYKEISCGDLVVNAIEC